MTAENFTFEPTSFFAGDSVKWTKSLEDYPASDGWTLRYALVKEGASIAIVSQAQDVDHAISITPTTSGEYDPGVYRWQSYVEKDDDRYTVGEGTIEIKANLADQAAGYDARLHVEKMVDALRAMLEKRADKAQTEMLVGREKIGLMPMHRIRELLSFYEGQLAKAKRAERIAQGLNGGGNILVRFSG